MFKAIIAVFLFSQLALASLPREAFSFFNEAKKITQETWNGLEACRLQQVNSYHPYLPYPQVSALTAVINRQWQLLAYYDEESYAGGNGYVVKSPNGGNRHSVYFNNSDLDVVTPYQGKVAWVNRFKTIEGWQYHFWCRGISIPVDYDIWRVCVKRDFIDVIASQLCRFS